MCIYMTYIKRYRCVYVYTHSYIHIYYSNLVWKNLIPEARVGERQEQLQECPYFCWFYFSPIKHMLYHWIQCIRKEHFSCIFSPLFDKLLWQHFETQLFSFPCYASKGVADSGCPMLLSLRATRSFPRQLPPALDFLYSFRKTLGLWPFFTQFSLT